MVFPTHPLQIQANSLIGYYVVINNVINKILHERSLSILLSLRLSCTSHYCLCSMASSPGSKFPYRPTRRRSLSNIW